MKKKQALTIIITICVALLLIFCYYAFAWTGTLDKILDPKRFAIQEETIVGVYGDEFIHTYQLWSTFPELDWDHTIYYEGNVVVSYSSEDDYVDIEGVRKDERGVVYEIYGKTFFRANGSDTFVEIREKIDGINSANCLSPTNLKPENRRRRGRAAPPETATA